MARMMPSTTPVEQPVTSTSAVIDAYDPVKNVLGTQRLTAAYLTAADAVAQAQIYALMVTQQVPLDVSGIDVGLAIKVSAYQAQLRSQGSYFLNTLLPAWIRLVTDAGNAAALMESAAQLSRPSLLKAFENAGARGEVSSIIGAVAEEIGDTSVRVGTLVTNISVAESALSTMSSRLDSAIDTTISTLDSSIKAKAKEIDDLTAAVNQNIEDIVAGANQVGGAVTDLGLGILTTISGTMKKPESTDGKSGGEVGDKTDDDTANKTGDDAGDKTDGESGEKGKSDSDEKSGTDPDADAGLKGDDNSGDDSSDISPDADAKPRFETRSLDAAEAPTTPSVDFAVTAIKGGSAGVAKLAAAQKALQENNEALARAYQALAAQSTLLAIAKAVQAQKELFVVTMSSLQTDAHALQMNWSSVLIGLNDFSNDVASISDQESATRLSILCAGARALWTDFGSELTSIRHSLTRSGGVPAA